MIKREDEYGKTIGKICEEKGMTVPQWFSRLHLDETFGDVGVYCCYDKRLSRKEQYKGVYTEKSVGPKD